MRQEPALQSGTRRMAAGGLNRTDVNISLNAEGSAVLDETEYR